MPKTGGYSVDIELTINGERTIVEAGSGDDLATVLRQRGYIDVKCGCDGGTCGASKVFVDGDVRMACGMEATDADGSEIQTVAALGTQADLHPVQQAFVDNFAVQCGFCIPGMVIEAVALLDSNPDPTEREVREALDDNVCRCTGYQKPVEAVLDAAQRMQGEQSVAADGGHPVTVAQHRDESTSCCGGGCDE
ncbi:carbon-monoxide dehydrogenase small subunit [Haloarcula quadrata]|jgi:carbon-monoxide dehydrogenase small subunit|uniref:(2Fe-2S)-binding protein n=4 Tax=Haloarcula TaxID=2237 RepID=Q5V6A4_HALMA|nr:MULTISPECIES: (2Fe-2S)-binding protein [Haloarcula]AAV44948.1 carbon monoxide dehydrogenase small subunit [Haloarcula marismortui ATCC 43049]EMA10534.1 carbon monoxide dehydrogenase small subunit [Haloarcula californiae ATCC 33799]EMA11076.1 carbon monoxide dehydrogenase small subunit [Haloarcula sinaiiensis ATCC 33800]NHN62706.1 (2Fe-2S)-binding protein [Haloarcula sp. JP-Z28]NHX40808.1 (2Fe-2S)-binding protein [Haloarcula sp. R1-2]